ncbi:hypothetical protein HY025_05000 [Candidatus Daviesbacteria bacterium]|nr:hypothetical protein [Candidatus Daviesbacteria bacterium]
MDQSILFVKKAIEFLKIVWGTIQKPYQTFRRLSFSKPFLQLFFVALLILIYLLLSTLAKEGLTANPFFLTKSIIKAGIAISFTFIVSSISIFLVGKLFQGVGDLSSLILLWAFSLLPTLSWFLLSTIFYVLIPPPRTMSVKGQIFSLLFLSFSLACFFWKGILYYLTLRIGLKLNAIKIFLVSLVIFPLGIVYYFILFKLGIFRVPFI